MNGKRIAWEDLPPDLTGKMLGPMPPKYFTSNGCSFAPDEIGPVDLRAACHWHDWAYQKGGNEKSRKQADRNLWINMQTCGASQRLATLYWFEVRAWGFDSFHYHGINPPGRLHRWWTRIISRFVTF